MKTELTPQLKEWMEQDAAAFEPSLAKARQAARAKMPLYMAGSIFALCGLGLAAGAGFPGILRLHLPIGIGIALFIALFTVWQVNAVINKKAVVQAYQRGAKRAFKTLTEPEQAIFCAQMREHRYSEIIQQERGAVFPAKIIIGPDYWVYRNASTSFWVKSSEATHVLLQTVTTPVTYATSSAKTRSKLAIGLELVVDYQPDAMAGVPYEVAMYFDNKSQAEPTLLLIQKHCPHISF